MNEYEAKAREFCEKTGTVITWEYESFRKYFPDDKDKRDVWTFTIERNGRSYSGTFGNSIAAYEQSLVNAMDSYSRGEYKKNPRSIYSQNLLNSATKGGRVRKPIQPREYDLLAGLQKLEVGSFDNFCADFGYNDRPLADYPKVMGIYQAVCEEYAAVLRLWPEPEVRAELEELN